LGLTQNVVAMARWVPPCPPLALEDPLTPLGTRSGGPFDTGVWGYSIMHAWISTCMPGRGRGGGGGGGGAVPLASAPRPGPKVSRRSICDDLPDPPGRSVLKTRLCGTLPVVPLRTAAYRHTVGTAGKQGTRARTVQPLRRRSGRQPAPALRCCAWRLAVLLFAYAWHAGRAGACRLLYLRMSAKLMRGGAGQGAVPSWEPAVKPGADLPRENLCRPSS